MTSFVYDAALSMTHRLYIRGSAAKIIPDVEAKPCAASLISKEARPIVLSVIGHRYLRAAEAAGCTYGSKSYQRYPIGRGRTPH